MDALPGWPCALLPPAPPSVADRLSSPVTGDLTAQVIAEAPRGAAWGTDEYGDGQGASPVQRRFWTGIAAFAAYLYASAFDLAVQAFPSAVTTTLDDWEAEYGLPDPCISPASGTAGRVLALRARYAAVGGASLAYFYCLAVSIGYDITITEPSQFTCDVSECDGPDEVSNINLHDTWIVSFPGEALTF